MNYNLENEKPETVLEPFLEEFYTSRIGEVNTLSTLVQTGEMKKISGIAHSWKGFSKPYGFDFLGEVGVELEKAAKASDKELCEKLLVHVRNYLSDKKKFLGF